MDAFTIQVASAAPGGRCPAWMGRHCKELLSPSGWVPKNRTVFLLVRDPDYPAAEALVTELKSWGYSDVRVELVM